MTWGNSENWRLLSIKITSELFAELYAFLQEKIQDIGEKIQDIGETAYLKQIPHFTSF